MGMERKLLHVVSDYAQGSLGAGNLQASILSSLPKGWDLIYSSVYNFDTLSAGYLLGQYGLQNEDLRPSELMLIRTASSRFAPVKSQLSMLFPRNVIARRLVRERSAEDRSAKSSMVSVNFDPDRFAWVR